MMECAEWISVRRAGRLDRAGHGLDVLLQCGRMIIAAVCLLCPFMVQGGPLGEESIQGQAGVSHLTKNSRTKSSETGERNRSILTIHCWTHFGQAEVWARVRGEKLGKGRKEGGREKEDKARGGERDVPGAGGGSTWPKLGRRALVGIITQILIKNHSRVSGRFAALKPLSTARAARLRRPDQWQHWQAFKY
jgi:hypothetical protein